MKLFKTKEETQSKVYFDYVLHLMRLVTGWLSSYQGIMKSILLFGKT